MAKSASLFETPSPALLALRNDATATRIMGVVPLLLGITAVIAGVGGILASLAPEGTPSFFAPASFSDEDAPVVFVAVGIAMLIVGLGCLLFRSGTIFDRGLACATIWEGVLWMRREESVSFSEIDRVRVCLVPARTEDERASTRVDLVLKDDRELRIYSGERAAAAEIGSAIGRHTGLPVEDLSGRLP